MSRLYYDVSAVKWNEALLLCNGSLGAMVFVGVMLKRIQRLFPFAQFIIVTTSKSLAFSSDEIRRKYRSLPHANKVSLFPLRV